MPDTAPAGMAKSRGLITDTEAERIAGEVDVEDSKRYQAISRVRRRIREQLPEDIALLEEHHPDLLNELREVVCEGAESITVGRVTLTEGDRYEVVGPVPIEEADHGRQFTIQDIVTPIGDETAGLLIQFEDEDNFQYTPIGHVADSVDDGRLDAVDGGETDE